MEVLPILVPNPLAYVFLIKHYVISTLSVSVDVAIKHWLYLIILFLTSTMIPLFWDRWLSMIEHDVIIEFVFSNVKVEPHYGNNIPTPSLSWLGMLQLIIKLYLYVLFVKQSSYMYKVPRKTTSENWRILDTLTLPWISSWAKGVPSKNVM